MRLWLGISLASILLMSCAGTAHAQTDSATQDSSWQLPGFTAPEIPIGGEDPRLDSIIRPWLGTRNRYGKQSKDAIDCSGFVQVILQDYLGYKTARSSAQNFLYGDSVDLDQLRPGDVVFFSNKRHKRIDHSGVWIGNGRFAHSSTSSGVIITEFAKDHYWSTHFRGARRYVINPAFPPVTTELPEFTDPKDSTP